MKKRFIAFISLIMSMLIACVSLAGCNVITKDSERDMEQVVASVKIDATITEEQLTTITKKDLILAYINNASSLSEDYTQAQAVNYIVDGLVESKIIVQYAIKAFDEGITPFENVYKDASVTNKWDITRYLTAEDKVNAEYNTKTALAGLVESYDDVDEDNVDTYIGTVRTAPTNAANYVKELSQAEKIAYNEEFENDDRFERESFLKTIKLIDNNGLKGKDYDGTLVSTEYYKQYLYSCYEDIVLERYSSILATNSLKKVSFEALNEKFMEKVNEQATWSNADFIEALSNASVNSPVLYSAFGTYGYVYNLLLGIDTEQSEDISEVKTEKNLTDAEYATKRNDILASTIVKDLRSSWITAGYDFDGTKFTGDYSLAGDDSALAFQGTVTLLNPDESEDEDFKGEYRVDSLKEFTLTEFIAFMDGHLGATSVTAKDYVGDNALSVLNGKIYELDGVEKYDEKINDLLFAFSTDSGSLNTFKGYTIKPEVDGSDTEEYVTTFAEAGRKLLENGKDGYVIVASDYGYHVMFFSEVLTANIGGYTSLVEFLNATEGVKDWEAEYDNLLENWLDYEEVDSYLYLLVNEISSNRVNDEINKVRTKIINQYRYDSTDYVTIYEDTYANLLGE